MRALGDIIVVEKVNQKISTVIEISDDVHVPLYAGKVTHLGPGLPLDDGTRRPIDLNVGDYVIFSSATGVPLKKLLDQDLITMHEADVVMVVDEEEIPRIVEGDDPLLLSVGAH